MIEIVKAQEKHVTAIGQLWCELMIFHQNIDPIFTPREGTIAGFEENQVRRLMKAEDGLVLVALDKGRVIGYSLSETRGPSPGYKREKYGNIDNTAVTAAYRRKGIGEKMVAEIMKWFRSKGINRMELSVAHGNPVGGPFWKKQGFKDYLHRLYLDI